jgi:hypothetical protein
VREPTNHEPLRSSFLQSDLTKAIKGAAASGVQIARVEISSGTISVIFGKPKSSGPIEHDETAEMR